MLPRTAAPHPVQNELAQVKAEMVLVPESLPLATDVDSTVPMDLSEGVPAPVQSMLRAEEAAVNAEPTPKKVSWAFTFLVGSTNSEVIGVTMQKRLSQFD